MRDICERRHAVRTGANAVSLNQRARHVSYDARELHAIGGVAGNHVPFARCRTSHTRVHGARLQQHTPAVRQRRRPGSVRADVVALDNVARAAGHRHPGLRIAADDVPLGRARAANSIARAHDRDAATAVPEVRRTVQPNADVVALDDVVASRR